MESNGSIAFSFSDFPEDVQLCILSYLDQSELATFSCTCKRFLSLCRNDPRLWFSMCDRRWGSKTLIKKWGNGKISYKRLYKAFLEYENLIGFWRRCGSTAAAVLPPSPLVFFEWGPFYITGSRVLPSKTGTYEVIKLPFLWISLTSEGESINYLDPEGKLELSENFVDPGELGFLENELIPVNVSFMGDCHVLLEENVNHSGCKSSSSLSSSPNKGFMKTSSSGSLSGEEYEYVSGSPESLPDRLMSEIYQHFANRTIPGGNGLLRRQRKREKEKQGRRKLEPEHFVKIVNCSPTPARPLQGLWKGFCDDMSLEFYLTSYDDIGGIACRRIGESSRPFNGYNPVFWTSNTALIEPPFSAEEEYEYKSRIHLWPPAEIDDCHEHPHYSDHGAVSRMLHMTSSCDLVIPGATINLRQVEGRIWQYRNGTFGFGFLRNNYVIDLKHIAQDGHLLDTMEFSDG